MKPSFRPLVPSLIAVTASLTACVAALAAPADQNWPSWRGPTGNGVSATARPPLEWSETQNVRWKVALPGQGAASPVVWGDQVFILAAVPTGKPAVAVPAAPAPPPAPADGGRRRGGGGGGGETVTEQRFVVMALDRSTGKTLWEHSPRTQVPHEGHHPDHDFASGSPVTDGEVLIAHFGSFGTYAYDLKGKLLWEKDLGDMRTRNSFGEGSSPALSGDTVVVLWDHEGEDFIVALGKRDGKELWRAKRDEPTGWCTPLIVEHAGKKQVVVNGARKARGYDLATGVLLWEAGGQTANAIPSAVAGQGRVYLMSGFRGSALQGITLGRTGDLTGTGAIAWSLGKNTPYVPSPVLYGDQLYFVRGNDAMLSVVDAKDGRVQVDAERLSGISGVYASPVGAADRIYFAGRDGGSLVLKRSDKLEILASNRLDDGFDASPALAGDQIFLRGRKSLYCLAGPK